MKKQTVVENIDDIEEEQEEGEIIDEGVNDDQDNEDDEEVKKSGRPAAKTIVPLKEIGKTITGVKKELERLKKRVNVRQNRYLFEEEVRNPLVYDRIIGMVLQLKEQQRQLVLTTKRKSKMRYLRPVMRTFINSHPLTDEQPTMPRLSKGKGIGSKQMISSYVHAYLRVNCAKIGAYSYELNDDMKTLVKEISGEERDTLGFSTIPSLVMSMLIPGVDPIGEDVELYKNVLEWFVNVGKGVGREKKGKESTIAETEEIEDEDG